MGLFHRQMGIFRAGGSCRISLACALSLLAGLAPGFEDAFAEGFAARTCRKVALTDAGTGLAVSGAEALALSEDETSLFVSAYDRRTETGAGIPPQGGLYRLDVADLITAHSLTARSLSLDGDPVGGFRPHGLAVFEPAGDAPLLAVINRRYVKRADGGYRFHPAIEVFRNSDGKWNHFRTLQHAGLCRANDLDFLDGKTLVVSIDRSVCADFTVSEDGFGFPGGFLARVGFGSSGITRYDPLDTPRLDFPNGVAVDRVRDAVYIAATKGAEILVFNRTDLLTGTAIVPSARLPIPGHPDNLSLAALHGAERRLVAAVYPDLLAFAAYRYNWFGVQKTASKILALGQDGSVSVLFDDPDGSVFSGASSAVLAHSVHSGPDPVLIAGSVGDDGLLVCTGRQAT